LRPEKYDAKSARKSVGTPTSRANSANTSPAFAVDSTGYTLVNVPEVHHKNFLQKFSGILQKIDQFSVFFLKMAHFLNFSVTPKSGAFWKSHSWKFPEKKMSNGSDFTPISVIILIIFSIFSLFMFRVSQKFVSKLAFLIICLVAEGTPSKLNPTNFLPIKFIPCKNGTLRSKKQLLLCLLSFEGVQRGNISGIQEKSNRQTTETGCV
jgi:hypothetical protein